MALESLEPRALLSNVVAVYDPLTDLLTITGDTHNDSFSITEHATIAGGTVTVAPTAPTTTINTTPVPFTTTGPVTSIVVSLPGQLNRDDVSLTGAGQTVPTTVKTVTITATGANLTFNANGVDNAGPFSLSNLPPGPAFIGGQLDATVSGSTFASLSIAQTGCCSADVELTHDTVPGSVRVTEGNADNDAITLASNDHFGSTYLAQGTGGPSNYLGDGDHICVTTGADEDPAPTSVKDLTISQANGDNNLIYVDTVAVSLISFGVKTTQGSGRQDATVICGVTVPSLTTNAIPAVPPSISVTQNDIKEQPGTPQGDYADVANSSVPGNISITQGNADGDYAEIIGSSAGFTMPFGPYVLDQFGDVDISQGDGCHDVVVLDQNLGHNDSLNNATIKQGDSICSLGCTLAPGDVAQINDTNVTSDLTISQGSAAALGNNVAAIGYASVASDPGLPFTPPLGNCTPDPSCFSTGFASSPVTAGGWTHITQNGANNSVYLGDTVSSFTTTFLDINTGGGGGGFVEATNTTVLEGSNLGNDFVIDGGGTGNTYFDNGGNSGVIAKYSNDPPSPTNGDPPAPPVNDPPAPPANDPPAPPANDPPAPPVNDPPTVASNNPPTTTNNNPPPMGNSAGGAGSDILGLVVGQGSGGGQGGVPRVRLTIRVVTVDHRRQVLVFNTATGTLRFSISPFGKSYRGNFRVHTRDVNGDGIPDIITRIRLGHDRFITRVFSGLDGSPLPGGTSSRSPEPSGDSTVPHPLRRWLERFTHHHH